MTSNSFRFGHFLRMTHAMQKTSTHRIRMIWSIVWIIWQFKVLKSHSKASRTCISVFVMTITEADYKLLPCSFVQFQFLQQRTSGWLGSSFLYKHWLHNSWMLNDFIKSLAHCSRCLLLSILQEVLFFYHLSDIAHLSTIKTLSPVLAALQPEITESVMMSAGDTMMCPHVIPDVMAWVHWER